ncbi:hypothetical protein L917_10012 [Phytophthora nicotianae]|uniref:RxLR effector protein n=1 Tax=Phytophthora nicotianae TaxID=4792 RepID=A0A0W8DYC8_PHYNI|nr:hypothetical protein L917_10012 [Phytophthora nicotianae]KUG01408.1 hypothetical protein AM587_10008852 [Phytophthora nicotianae]KUG01412.1 hypothetical protein AM587_10008856 [Phytophthora nicotianae]
MKWKIRGKSVDGVTKLLDFRTNKYLGEKFQILDDYVTLVKQSDDTLFSTLIKRSKSRYDKKVTKLEDILISQWTRKGELPANVHGWLHLYGSVDDAFTPNNLNRFVKYVDDFNAKNPNKEKPVIDLYTRAFGDAPVLSKLIAAMDDSTANAAAKKLLVESWIKNKQSVDDALAMLNINIGQSSTIINHKIDALEQLDNVKGAKPSVIKTLTKTVGGNRMLAKILERTEAPTLQKKQFIMWIDDGVTPGNFMAKIYKDAAVDSVEKKNIATKFTAFYESQKSLIA